MTYFTLLQALRQKGCKAALITVVESAGSAPRGAGARMLVYSDGEISGTIGGGAVEKRIIEEALSLLSSGGTRLVRLNLEQDVAMACGGTMTFFLEVLLPEQKLIIFGAGHICLALLPLAKMLGFHVTVIDNRPEYATAKRLVQADRVVAEPYARALADLRTDEATFLVILTHRHLHDQEILEHCCRLPFAYLGMIGSRSKVSAGLARLQELGIADKVIEKIHSPIGLHLGGQSPEEIAIAIAAEWIAVRNHLSAVDFMKRTLPS